jgi:hypothetical protein
LKFQVSNKNVGLKPSFEAGLQVLVKQEVTEERNSTTIFVQQFSVQN